MYFEVNGLEEEDEDGSHVVEGYRSADGQVLEAVEEGDVCEVHHYHPAHDVPEY